MSFSAPINKDHHLRSVTGYNYPHIYLIPGLFFHLSSGKLSWSCIFHTEHLEKWEICIGLWQSTKGACMRSDIEWKPGRKLVGYIAV